MGAEKPVNNSESLSSHESSTDDFIEFDADAARERIAQYEQEKRDLQMRKIGAKVLAISGFIGRHKEIVTSSFDAAREAKQKLFGNNNERRTDAYITRLERVINRNGPKAEERLWHFTASSEDLLVQSENIPNSYWETRAQEDDFVTLEEEVDKIRGQQRDSIRNWSNYFGHEECPFPMWFKLYAWDGVTKMSSVYDKDARRFAKRDETTVAPYPNINPAALAKTYEAICRANGLEDFADTENPELDEETKKLVDTYNFNRIYSHFVTELSASPEVPENAEDIHGEWIEYSPGQEHELADASTGTPWCIASPTMGRDYFEKGGQGQSNSDTTEGESRAKFYLFHLQNRDTGDIANTACASIRLDRDGQIAEISGIRDGQVLNDSLLPTVEEKVLSLPGGERYRDPFADKYKLIEVGKKMRAGQELTADELRFIYEADRPINRLELYGDDPRIAEARNKYGVDVLAKKGILSRREISKIMAESKTEVEDVAPFIEAGLSISQIVESDNYNKSQDVDHLIEHGVPHQDIVRLLGVDWSVQNSDYLASRGFAAAEIASAMSPADQIGNLDFLENNQIPYDIGQLIKKCDERTILDYSDSIMAHGGKINFRKLARGMDEVELVKYADVLCANGAEKRVRKAMEKLRKDHDGTYRSKARDNIGALLASGVDIPELNEMIHPEYDAEMVLLHFDELTARGVDANVKVENIDFKSVIEIESLFEAILQHPDVIDPKEAYARLPDWQRIRVLDVFADHGVEVDNLSEVVADLSPDNKIRYAETLMKNGIDVDANHELSQINSDSLYYLLLNNSDLLQRLNADMGYIVNKISSNSKYAPGTPAMNAIKPILWRLGFAPSPQQVAAY